MSRDSQDVARLFQKHGPLVYGRARRLLGTHEDAEEATQEIFIRVLGGRELPPPGELILWLCRMTTNYCLNKLRDGQRRSQLFSQRFAPATSDSHSGNAEALAQVRALLQHADGRQAQAAVYVYVDGMSHDEAAEMMGVSPRTVGNLLIRFQQWARERSGAPGLARAGGAR